MRNQSVEKNNEVNQNDEALLDLLKVTTQLPQNPNLFLDPFETGDNKFLR